MAIIKTLTIEQKKQELKNINFFVGGLTDEAIEYYYNKNFNQTKTLIR